MLIRKQEEKINNWINKSNKALLIYGARQVGKTYIIRKCVNASSYKLVEFNFLKNPELIEALKSSNTSNDLVMNLSLLTNEKFVPSKTIIFFDEIQEYKEIVTKIKFFVDEGQFKFVLSGSLLGVELKNIKSAPVGYVQLLTMYPLDFEEFIQIYNVSSATIDELKKSFENKVPVNDFLHDRLLKMFKQYLVIGGMPSAVEKFVETSSLDEVMIEHDSIISSYKLDFTKYEEENRKLEITKVYELIPAELNSKNKRFNFKSVEENLIYDRGKDNFLWLTKAGVAIPIYNTTEPVIPLMINEKSNLFKLFLSDIGLLSTEYGKSFKNAILNFDDNINYGAVYENVVAQELIAHGFKGYYYSNKKQGELDFIIEYKNKVLPIEVKSGKDYKRHSALTKVLELDNYGLSEAIVFTNSNLQVEEKITYLPIYMVMFLVNNDEEVIININDLKF